MNYIIHLENGLYFAGWHKLGEQKFVPEKEHAYRMLRTVAMRTQPKIHALSTIERAAEDNPGLVCKPSRKDFEMPDMALRIAYHIGNRPGFPTER